MYPRKSTAVSLYLSERIDMLKVMVRAQHAQHEQCVATLELRAREIAHLKLQRMLFGAQSERLVRQVGQLELQFEELETSRGEE